jgi:hypothetical protein
MSNQVCEGLLKKFDMADAKPIKTVMALNGHLDLNEEGKSVDLHDWFSSLSLCI